MNAMKTTTMFWTWTIEWIVSNCIVNLIEILITIKQEIDAIKQQMPAMVSMSLRLFYTTDREIPLKSFSQETLSEYLAANQAVASSW